MKDLSRLSILLFILLFTFISSLDQNRYEHYHPNQKNRTHPTHDYNRNTDNYQYDHFNHYYNDYNRFQNNESCPLYIIIAGALLSLWSSLFVLYFIVNRRKKSFTVMINRDENNKPGYMNV